MSHAICMVVQNGGGYVYTGGIERYQILLKLRKNVVIYNI